MRTRRLIMSLVVTVAALGPIGAAQGLAYMRSSYGGACVRLSGLPGVLQGMKLLAQGDCKVAKGNACQSTNAKCTIPAPTGTKTGRCQNVSNVCQCVAN